MTIVYDYEVKVGEKNTVQVTKTATLNNESDLGEPVWVGTSVTDGYGGMVISDRGADDEKIIVDTARNTYKALVTKATGTVVEGQSIYFIAGGRDGNQALLTTVAASNGLYGHVTLDSDDALPVIADGEAGWLNIQQA